MRFRLDCCKINRVLQELEKRQTRVEVRRDGLSIDLKCEVWALTKLKRAILRCGC